MNADFDVVVAGAGHNSLVAAAYLAAAGMKVLVLERNAWIGGGAVTREVTVPGFRHDLHSTAHIMIQSNPLINRDELGLIGKFGLEYIRPEISFASVFDDGSVVLTYHDLDKTCESLAKISPR
ncbi:FAD-dependent oxidoreductase, partial [Sphingobium sp. BS19]